MTPTKLKTFAMFLCFFVLAMLVLGPTACPKLVAQQTEDKNTNETKKPNLLVIMTDEHNFRTLGCYRELLPEKQALMWGKAIVETPNIDWIAKNGAICTSYYATTPVCSPSRAALISGMYPHKTPVSTNNIPLDDKVITFAHLLKKVGYKTGFAGKWHLDGDGKPQWQPKRNFGFEDNRFMFNRGHWKNFKLTEKGPRVGARKNNRPTYAVDGADQTSFATDFLTDRTIDFIKANSDEPFCYMLSLPDPHGPDTVRAPYDTMFDNQKYVRPPSANKPVKGLPSWGQKQKGGFNMSKYYGMVKCIDDNVGRIFDELKKLEILENTIIVFTSDHGDLRGEHHRQNKGVPYEASTRVPMLIYFKGKIQPKTVVNQMLGSVDFLPTILSMMEVKTAKKEDGRDASRLLIGASDKPWTDIGFVRGTGVKNGWLMAASDRYKLVVSERDPPWLFDLERDPDEVINFFEHDGYRKTVQRMASSLVQYSKDHADPFFQGEKLRADLDWAVSGTGKYPGR